MPDIASFVRTTVQQAKDDSVLSAAASASVEAANWVVNRSGYNPGRLIWDDEWDVCLVLDATRADLWELEAYRYDWLPDYYDSPTEWSVGSASPEWYGHTFTPSALPDGERVGVVTANPFASKPSDTLDYLRDATPIDRHVAYAEYVHEHSWGCDVESGYVDVTHPAAVTDRAWRAWQERDPDRLVVHYMQPHIPFRSRPEWSGAWPDIDMVGEQVRDGKQAYIEPKKDVWKQLRDGERTHSEVWDAYRDNLRWVLDDVERLVEAVSGRVLVTSDHGNLVGEWGLWAHPPGVFVPAVRKVPWVFVSGNGAGELRPAEYDEYEVGERPVGSSDSDVGVDEQLRALGYTD